MMSLIESIWIGALAEGWLASNDRHEMLRLPDQYLSILTAGPLGILAIAGLMKEKPDISS